MEHAQKSTAYSCHINPYQIVFTIFGLILNWAEFSKSMQLGLYLTIFIVVCIVKKSRFLRVFHIPESPGNMRLHQYCTAIAAFQSKQKICEDRGDIFKRPSVTYCVMPNAGKYSPNLINSNRNQIVLTIFRFIWNQTDICLVPNQSENRKCNLISGWFNKI